MIFLEEIINKIINAMDDLTPEQVRQLRNVLIINLSNQAAPKNEVSTSTKSWEQIIKNYLGCKKLENCADGTLKNYQRILRTMYSDIGKPIKNIT